jgi:hypothetical protein
MEESWIFSSSSSKERTSCEEALSFSCSGSRLLLVNVLLGSDNGFSLAYNDFSIFFQFLAHGNGFLPSFSCSLILIANLL